MFYVLIKTQTYDKKLMEYSNYYSDFFDDFYDLSTFPILVM